MKVFCSLTFYVLLGKTMNIKLELTEDKILNSNNDDISVP